MKEYIYVLKLVQRLHDDQAWTELDNQAVNDHFLRLKTDHESGKVLHVGRTLDAVNGFGQVVFQAESDLEAEAYAQSDPAVQNGQMTVTWMEYKTVFDKSTNLPQKIHFKMTKEQRNQGILNILALLIFLFGSFIAKEMEDSWQVVPFLFTLFLIGIILFVCSFGPVYRSLVEASHKKRNLIIFSLSIFVIAVSIVLNIVFFNAYA
jgi:uncharacterized protein